MNNKILIVEDERVIALDIKNRLKKMGYNITNVVSTGEEALWEAKNNEPDVILMDILLSGKLDGINTAEKINRLKNIPIIYLTSYSDEYTIKRAKKTRYFGYILKPFNEVELSLKLKQAINKYNKSADGLSN